MATKYFQSKIYGKDAGGYLWENVFTIRSVYSGSQSTFEQALALNDFLVDTLVTDYCAAMSPSCSILAIGSREISPGGSLNAITNNVHVGTRTGVQNAGGVCGRIRFIPGEGSSRLSNFYAVGSLQTDFTADRIASAYQDLLDNLAGDFIGIDGSEPTYAWQFVQWHAKTETSTPIVSHDIAQAPTLLNKRVRA